MAPRFDGDETSCGLIARTRGAIDAPTSAGAVTPPSISAMPMFFDCRRDDGVDVAAPHAPMSVYLPIELYSRDDAGRAAAASRENTFCQ